MVGGPGLNKNTMQGKHQGSRTLLPYRRAMRSAGCLLLPPYLPCHDTRYPLIHSEQEWGQLLIRYLVPIIKKELIHSFPQNTKTWVETPWQTAEGFPHWVQTLTDKFHFSPYSVLCIHLFWTHHIFARSTTRMCCDCWSIPMPNLLTLKDSPSLHSKVSLNIYRTQPTRTLCLSFFFVHIHAGCPWLSDSQLLSSQHFHALYIDTP